MTLKKYKISKSHIEAVKRSGFDCHDVNKRYPVQNTELDKILASQNRALDPRARLLIKGREMFRGFKDRALMLASGLALTLAIPPEAWANTSPHETEGKIAPLYALLDVAAWSWELALLSGLLSTSLASLYLQARMFKMILPSYPKPKKSRRLNSIGRKVPKGNAEQVTPTPKLKWRVNGSSRMGKVRTENQDAYDFWRVSEDEVFMVVCDGAGGVDGGKEAAETAVQNIITILQAIYPEGGDPTDALEIAIEDARVFAKEHELAGITTAIIAHVKGDKLHYATLGDGTLSAVWPDGMVNHIQTPHNIQGQPSNIIAAYIGQGCAVPARTGSIRLEKGTTLMLMSDVASDLLPYEEFAAHRADYAQILKTKTDVPVADKLLEQIEVARDPDTNAYLHHDNMTLILAHFHEVLEPETTAVGTMPVSSMEVRHG
ncbi:PP2C family protein-serine/threonine phosphatase [Hellea balneolensis]|uniref:PP2C family protein-serine/threonine phosphatase n=1 Tax=Hellea balneolensis TaxID=287478 RepID=UPI0004167556|nr:protein phosphatase 2C domain-containing protein [Hellea balneolensis]